MGILSQGPFTYNRFDVLNEGSKPDFLDMDKDGDKKESMKKAINDKKKCGCDKKPCDCEDKKKNESFMDWAVNLLDEGYDLSDWTWDELHERYLEEMPASIASGKYGASPIANSASKSQAKKVPTSLTSGKYGTPVSSAPSVKEGKSYVPGAKVGVKVKKGPALKEDICEILIDEGFANNYVSAEIMFDHMSEEWLEELWKGKHGQSEKEYMDSRSDAGKQISGDSKQSGAAYSHRAYKGVGGPAKPGERQKAQGKMTDADRNELAIRKNALKKDAADKKKR